MRKAIFSGRRTLERSGVNVMYGLLGLKTHAKVLLVVRKEGNGLKRYVHLATGNYNQQTARLYEDVSLFTAREDLGEDATALFNLLTGYSAPNHWNQLLVAPLGLHEAVLGLIARETEHARHGRPAHIVAKMICASRPGNYRCTLCGFLGRCDNRFARARALLPQTWR